MTSTYPLGTSDRELERLAFQHEVWAPVTRAFLGRIGVGEGQRVLDLGCGPGFVAFDLAEMVGPGGSVIALDESPRWIAHVEREAKRRGLANVSPMCARIQDLCADVGASDGAFERSYDLVFTRWVFSFLPDPDAVAAKLAELLVPGGVLAIQDYNHEGISVFPESEGFRAVIRATRAEYARSGGDMWVAGRAARIFAAAGLELCDLRANSLCGGPDSPAFRWADGFFPHFAGTLVERGQLAESERDRYLREWEERKRDPTSLFFSPLVVDAAARRVER